MNLLRQWEMRHHRMHSWIQQCGHHRDLGLCRHHRERFHQRLLIVGQAMFKLSANTHPMASGHHHIANHWDLHLRQHMSIQHAVMINCRAMYKVVFLHRAMYKVLFLHRAMDKVVFLHQAMPKVVLLHRAMYKVVFLHRASLSRHAIDHKILQCLRYHHFMDREIPVDVRCREKVSVVG